MWVKMSHKNGSLLIREKRENLNGIRMPRADLPFDLRSLFRLVIAWGQWAQLLVIFFYQTRLSIGPIFFVNHFCSHSLCMSLI